MIFFGNCGNLAERDSSIIDHRVTLHGMTSDFGVKEMAVEMEKVSFCYFDKSVVEGKLAHKDMGERIETSNKIGNKELIPILH